MTLAAIRDLPIGTRFRYGDGGETWRRVEGETFEGHGCLAQHVGADGTLTTWDDGSPVLGAFFAGEVVEIIEQQEAA